MWRDVRFAVRLLVSRPGWTVAAILCLAIATGANTAAFSVVNALILRPLPFADAHELVMVALQERTRADTRPFSLAEYRDLAGRGNQSVHLIARTFLPLSLTTAGGARMVEAEFVSANYFDVLQVTPAAGQFFRADNDRIGSEPTAVISYQLWQRRFNSDPAIVGRTVRMNGRLFTVRAIAPAGSSSARPGSSLPTSGSPLRSSRNWRARPMRLARRCSASWAECRRAQRPNRSTPSWTPPLPRCGATARSTGPRSSCNARAVSASHQLRAHWSFKDPR